MTKKNRLLIRESRLSIGSIYTDETSQEFLKLFESEMQSFGFGLFGRSDSVKHRLTGPKLDFFFISLFLLVWPGVRTEKCLEWVPSTRSVSVIKLAGHTGKFITIQKKRDEDLSRI